MDWIHGEIFVPQIDRILVFPRDADGDTAPIRILGGLNSGIRASRLTVDPVHDLLIVSGRGLAIYDRQASGMAKPLRFISSEGAQGASLLTTNPESGMIFAAVRPGGRYLPEDYVGVWSVFDNGNAPPRYTIGGPNGLLSDARGIAVDAKNGNVIVSDKTLNAILTFHLPEAF